MRVHRLDRDTLEIAQARLLIERARSSGFSVFCLLSFYAVILTFTTPLALVALWFALGLGAIGLTLALPARYRSSGITSGNVSGYLQLHTVISCITGLIWGVGAAALTNVHSDLSIFTTTVIVLSITLGGISPQSAYRRSYVGLSTFALLPFATWLLVVAAWPISAIGIGVILAYAFFMSASARVEIGTRDMLAIKQNKQLIEELAEQHIALQRAHEEKTRFLAATSHDLAQPLHAQGFYLAALRAKLETADQLALLIKVEASWRGLGNLLDGLVDISRLDAGVIVPDMRVINLGALATRIGDEFAGAAAERGIAISVNAEPVFVCNDALILTRILRNLVSNAVKFTDHGSVTIAIVPGDRHVTISVTDTGCGIPEDKQDLVFDEYVQLGNAERDREKGLGLGLSIVRRLLRLLDLTIDLKSSPGEGTSISFELQRVAQAPIHDTDFDKDRIASRSPIGNLSVLLVDNEDAIRAGMTTVLTSWGCQVYSAKSAADVLEILAQAGASPQVLLVDQRLSEGETGLQVIEIVRDEINETVPAIVMTGDIASEDHMRDLDNISFLHKPVEPDRLHEILRRIAQAPSTEPKPALT